MKFMTKRFIGIISLAVALSSCGMFGGDERPVYQGAEYYKNLEVPPDLTEPDTGGQVQIPKPTVAALQSFNDQNELGVVITPKFDGIRLVSNAGLSWAEVDNNAEYVWGRLLEFWQTEGVEVVETRPLLGFMETEWTARLDADAGFFKSIFQRLEPDQKDKFRVRLEKFDDGNKTRLFISHSRIEKVVGGEYGEDFTWVTLPSDLGVEREILSRMILFSGKNKEQAAQLLQHYRPYSTLIKVEKTDTTTLTMKGSMDFVWRRAMRALDRMNMKDIREEKEADTIYFIAGEISANSLDVEKDEIAESSWLMQLFTGVDEEELLANKNRHYRLQFSDIGGRILIEVKDAKDTQITDEDGDTYSTALTEQIRNILVENLE